LAYVLIRGQCFSAEGGMANNSHFLKVFETLVQIPDIQQQ
jgi:hypothetical protein